MNCIEQDLFRYPDEKKILFEHFLLTVGVKPVP